ncbi:MAG TPA: TAXI family TRAP transporter solute-binding subunit [Xanthobacteraceae bacterium]
MPIRIGTSERDGTFYSQGHALKTVLQRRPALAPVEILESHSASTENAHRLHAGEIEFGFMASNWIGRAKAGEAPFAHPVELAMAAPMNAGPLFFIVPAESPIRSFSDLRGRRLAVGLRTSGMAQHAHGLLGALGMSFSDFSPVHLDFAAGADALARGEVDAQFQCPIPNAVMTELAQRIALRVLPYGAGELEQVMAAVPYYRRTVMRQGAIRGLAADLPQVAVINVLVTHSRVPESIVGEAVAAIVTGSGELARLNPLFSGLEELFEPLRSRGRASLEFGGVALHPGALRAYRELRLLT